MYSEDELYAETNKNLPDLTDDDAYMDYAVLRCEIDELRKERDTLKRQLQMNKHPISITHDRELEKEAEQLRKERDELKKACGEAYIYLASCLVYMEDPESHKNLKNMAMKMRDLSEETPEGKE